MAHYKRLAANGPSYKWNAIQSTGFSKSPGVQVRSTFESLDCSLMICPHLPAGAMPLLVVNVGAKEREVVSMCLLVASNFALPAEAVMNKANSRCVEHIETCPISAAKPSSETSSIIEGF